MRVVLAMVLAAALAGVAAAADFQIASFKRKVDLSGSLVRVTSQITATREGSASEFIFLVPAAEAEALTFAVAKDGRGKKLDVTRDPVTPGSDGVVRIAVPGDAGEEVTLKVTTLFKETLRPLPAKVAQGDPQLVVYEGSAGSYAAYPVAMGATRVALPTTRIESYSSDSGSEGSGSWDKGRKSVSYGPYEAESPKTARPIRVHFETGARLASFREVEREVTVSHWAAKVHVEEHFELENWGSALKEGFARVEYQPPLRREGNSFRELQAVLPMGAKEIYYRDIIGNISTSHVREEPSKERTLMEIEARFPLFGGWRTVWYQGYDLGAEHCLFRDGETGRYHLRIPAQIPYGKMVADQVRTRLILPELAEDVEITFSGEFPDAIVDQSTSTRFTYLDAPNAGRPVHVIDAKGLTPLHKGDILVSYSLPPLAIWREPAMFTGLIFILFSSLLLLSRIDLSL